MVRLFTTVIIFLLFFNPACKSYAQNTSDISSKQKELKTIKSEISSLEKEIQNKSKKEKETFSLLQNYDKQNFLLNKIIARYRSEEKQKEDQITETELKINILSKEISRLQNNYAKYVNAVYRKGKQSELAVIFNSESISQALRRIYYLKRFSERREKDLINFEKNKSELLAAKTQLEKEKTEKSLLVQKKLEEEIILKNKLSERRRILNVIRKDKTELKKELDAKKQAETTIRNLIARLNEEKISRDKELKEKLRMNEKKLAEKKKEELTNERTKPINKKSSEDEILLKNYSSFEQLKGKLIWPVNNGKIVKKFGENKNLILNTITLNYGVDIKITSDKNAKAVSNGIVSAIEWIPGYGSIVIISHSDDYRTVYSHLEEIYVQEGDEVTIGQTIASVGESIEGNVLHFEIWNSRANQDPEIWLAKK
jgi:septal ring factor EnvC (AmiA/AmiB activator)